MSATAPDSWPVRFTPEQAAALVGGVDPATGRPHFTARFVLDAYRAGRVAGCRIGGRVLFSRTQLDAWINTAGFEPFPDQPGQPR